MIGISGDSRVIIWFLVRFGLGLTSAFVTGAVVAGVNVIQSAMQKKKKKKKSMMVGLL